MSKALSSILASCGPLNFDPGSRRRRNKRAEKEEESHGGKERRVGKREKNTLTHTHREIL